MVVVVVVVVVWYLSECEAGTLRSLELYCSCFCLLLVIDVGQWTGELTPFILQDLHRFLNLASIGCQAHSMKQGLWCAPRLEEESQERPKWQWQWTVGALDRVDLFDSMRTLRGWFGEIDAHPCHRHEYFVLRPETIKNAINTPAFLSRRPSLTTQQSNSPTRLN
ncbi:hypothetical protein B0O80DRAFT_150926 [Mortierella sp. GBAus27b]|nr:hypothetical protein B0O80DRAFT_150926 [Mortierella sp. GBAus27b]